MSRCLLVNVPFYRLLGSHHNGLPLGLGYIAAVLNSHGHDAWIYNADFSSTTTYRSPREMCDGARDNADTFREIGPIIAECVDSIAAFRPGVLGYTCFTPIVPVIAQISRLVRERLPTIRQIVGGPHATLDENLPAQLPDVDCFVCGEGDGLSDVWLGGEKRAAVPRIRDLNRLPFPEREKLWCRGAPITAADRILFDVCSISTARGCPWRCNYCASPQIWPRVVSRSVESVLAEIRLLVDNHLDVESSANNAIHFIDDTFTANRRRAMSVMQGIIDLGRPVPWRCEARADTITPDLARMMARSGCIRVKIGVESGSDRMLRAINKGETKRDILRGIKMLHGSGIGVTAYLMVGFPGETDANVRETIRFTRQLPVDHFSLSIVVPYFGTKIYRDAVAAGVRLDELPKEQFFHQTGSAVLAPQISQEVIDELWAICDVDSTKSQAATAAA